MQAITSFKWHLFKYGTGFNKTKSKQFKRDVCGYEWYLYITPVSIICIELVGVFIEHAEDDSYTPK